MTTSNPTSAADVAREIIDVLGYAVPAGWKDEFVERTEAIIDRHTQAAVTAATKPLVELMESINADLNVEYARSRALVEALEMARAELRHRCPGDGTVPHTIRAIDEALAQAKGNGDE